VYGLCCDPGNKRAIDRLYQLKELDRSHKMTFVCRDLAQVSKYAIMHDAVYHTLKRYLPGPYTFIVDATREVPRILQTPRKAIGIRVPDHAVPLALAEELGRPLFSTTAAKPGSAPHPDPKEIDTTFPGLALVLDAGPGGVVPSSVIDLTGASPRVVREGAGDVAAFEG
jgi:tRNA threonylcarbamoyl adenosine modification protein (Sua5/YciO/YrdC/YwlC family)